MKGRRSARRDQDAFERRGAGRRAGPRKARSLAVLFDVQLDAEVNRKFLTEDGSELLRDVRVAQRREMIALLENRGLNAQSRQRLCELETQRTCSDDRDRARQRGKLENRLIGQNDVAEAIERLRHARSGARGDYDRLGGDLAPIVERERVLSANCARWRTQMPSGIFPIDLSVAATKPSRSLRRRRMTAQPSTFSLVARIPNVEA